MKVNELDSSSCVTAREAGYDESDRIEVPSRGGVETILAIKGGAGDE
jgi:hypothetical protein